MFSHFVVIYHLIYLYINLLFCLVKIYKNVIFVVHISHILMVQYKQSVCNFRCLAYQMSRSTTKTFDAFCVKVDITACCIVIIYLVVLQ